MLMNVKMEEQYLLLGWVSDSYDLLGLLLWVDLS